jgi:NAD(P)-dependent dehydrogenase (short-subunit alcohol dehydrogenase family)
MPTALITGTSSGIGRACVTRLAEDGWRVYAGVRSETDLEAVGAEPGDVEPLRLDVTDADSIAAAATRIEAETGGHLDALVNNAGIGFAGALEVVPPEDLRRIFEVNVIGQIAVAQALLPLLRSAGGKIVIVGSVGGRVAFPYAGPYHGTKYALEGLADSLRAELAPQGVAVSLIEPGPISTDLGEGARAGLAAARRPRGRGGEALRGRVGRLRRAAANRR